MNQMPTNGIPRITTPPRSPNLRLQQSLSNGSVADGAYLACHGRGSRDSAERKSSSLHSMTSSYTHARHRPIVRRCLYPRLANYNRSATGANRIAWFPALYSWENSLLIKKKRHRPARCVTIPQIIGASVFVPRGGDRCWRFGFFLFFPSSINYGE